MFTVLHACDPLALDTLLVLAHHFLVFFMGKHEFRCAAIWVPKI